MSVTEWSLEACSREELSGRKKSGALERVEGRRTWCCPRWLRLLSLTNGAGRHEGATAVGSFLVGETG